MEDIKHLVDKIKKFYTLLETHDNQIQDWISEAKKPLHSIVNQSLIYRAAIPENSIRNLPFNCFKNFREDLIETILMSLENEREVLENIRTKIDAANKALEKQQSIIEDLFFNLRSKTLNFKLELNPCAPSFEHVVDWCFDAWHYYYCFYLQISQAVFNLDFGNENSVIALTEAFEEDSEMKIHINKIRSFNFSKFDFLL